MWISFAYTTDAVIMGRKNRTRRAWADSHAQKFYMDQVVDFYDRNPRNGGQVMGSIILTAPLRRQNTRKLVNADFQLEGFDYMTERNQTIGSVEPLIFFNTWKKSAIDFWVVDFRLHLLTVAGMERRLLLQGQASDNGGTDENE